MNSCGEKGSGSRSSGAHDWWKKEKTLMLWFFFLSAFLFAPFDFSFCFFIGSLSSTTFPDFFSFFQRGRSFSGY